MELRPNKHHGAKVQCLGSTHEQMGGEHCSLYKHGHYPSVLPSFSDRAHGVPFLRGKEECAECAGRN